MLPLTTIPRHSVMLYLYKGILKDILGLIIQGKVKEGEYIGQFEKAFAGYVGTKDAIVVSSGRMALKLILQSCGLNQGDEVIIPAYTFYVVPQVVKDMGFKPTFVDIGIDTLNMDVSIIENRISEKTKVIIATHLFGQPCDVYSLLEVARRHSLFVIEDCAHAPGAEYDGKRVGSFGDAAIFSLETVKPIHTFGGGIITTRNQLLAKTMRKRLLKYPFINSGQLAKKMIFTLFENLITRPLFFTFFIYPLYFIMLSLFDIDPVDIFKKAKKGFRYKTGRFTNLQALVGLKQLRNLDGNNERCASNAEVLSTLLSKDIPVQKTHKGANPVYYHYIIRSNDIKSLRKRLLFAGIDTGKNVMQNCAQIYGEDGSAVCPNAERALKTALQVPVYAGISKSRIKHIAKILNKSM